MYVYMHTYIHVYIHAYMSAFVYVGRHVCMHTCVPCKCMSIAWSIIGKTYNIIILSHISVYMYNCSYVIII